MSDYADAIEFWQWICPRCNVSNSLALKPECGDKLLCYNCSKQCEIGAIYCGQL